MNSSSGGVADERNVCVLLIMVGAFVASILDTMIIATREIIWVVIIAIFSKGYFPSLESLGLNTVNSNIGSIITEMALYFAICILYCRCDVGLFSWSATLDFSVVGVWVWVGIFLVGLWVVSCRCCLRLCLLGLILLIPVFLCGGLLWSLRLRVVGCLLEFFRGLRLRFLGLFCLVFLTGLRLACILCL